MMHMRAKDKAEQAQALMGTESHKGAWLFVWAGKVQVDSKCLDDVCFPEGLNRQATEQQVGGVIHCVHTVQLEGFLSYRHRQLRNCQGGTQNDQICFIFSSKYEHSSKGLSSCRHKQHCCE